MDISFDFKYLRFIKINFSKKAEVSQKNSLAWVFGLGFL